MPGTKCQTRGDHGHLFPFTHLCSILQVGPSLWPQQSLGLPPGLKHSPLVNHDGHLDCGLSEHLLCGFVFRCITQGFQLTQFVDFTESTSCKSLFKERQMSLILWKVSLPNFLSQLAQRLVPGNLQSNIFCIYLYTLSFSSVFSCLS